MSPKLSRLPTQLGVRLPHDANDDVEYLYPSFVGRLGALSSIVVDRLTSSRLVLALEVAEASRWRCHQAANQSSQALYTMIGETTDPKRRSALLRVRRSIHNGRSVSSTDRSTLATEGDAIAIVSRIEELREQESAALDELRSAFSEARVSSRAMIADVLATSDFADGVLLSSPTLYRNFARYAVARRGRFSARDLQIERGILRYLTRAAMKATPFASFCFVVPGQFIPVVEYDRNAFVAKGSLGPRKSIVRLNKAIFGRLWVHLKGDRHYRQVLVLELNPSCRLDADGYRFLAEIRGREVFQRIEANDAVDLVVGALSTGRTASYRQVCEMFALDARIDASPEEVRTYLDHLLSTGLLRFQCPVPAQEADWVVPFCAFLRATNDETACDLAGRLEDLRGVASDLGATPTQSRQAIFEDLRERLRLLCDSVGLTPPTAGSIAIYEDCGAPLALEWSYTSDEAGVFRALRALTEAQLSTAVWRAEMATLRRFFELHYPLDAEVPLMQFYEDYYRLHYRQHLENAARLRRGEALESGGPYRPENPFDLAEVEAIYRRNSANTEAIRKVWASNADAEEVIVTADHIAPLESAGERAMSGPRSVAMFCQPAMRGTRLIVNAGHLYLGFGKYFSRFLSLLPHEFTSDLRASLQKHGALLAEISGDANFNGNFHPALLEAIVAYPTGDAEVGGDGIPVDDIIVALSGDQSLSLELRTRSTGRRIYPLDLGFLNPRMRPPLFQLLTKFAPASATAIALPQSVDPTVPVTSLGIEYRPRIVYEGRIVLSRRRWRIPKSLFPWRQTGEDDATYFMRLNRWQRDNGIPREVYVRVSILPSGPLNPQRVVGATTDSEPTEVEANNDSASSLNESASELDDADWSAANENDDSGSADESSRREPNLKPEDREANAQAVLAGTRRSKDFQKPQYINFASPLLGDLFARIPAGLENFGQVQKSV